jgi:anti-sigma B factor antagonist
MRISEHSTDDVTILDLLTPLTGDHSRRLFVPQIEALLAEGRKLLVLNMEQMNWLNSTGVGSLVSAHRKVEEMGGRIVIASPNERVRDIMKVVGLAAVWSVYPTVEEAVASFEQQAEN